jgi:predicted metal-dependent RNase
MSNVAEFSSESHTPYMPKPLNIDWQAIQALFVQGNSASDISRMPDYAGVKPSAISARALRGNWMDLRQQTRRIVSKAAESVIIRDLKAQASEFVEGMAEEMTSSLKIARAIPKKYDLEDLYSRLAVLEKLSVVGRKTFRLDDEAAKIVLNVGVVSSSSLLPFEPENEPPRLEA